MYPPGSYISASGDIHSIKYFANCKLVLRKSSNINPVALREAKVVYNFGLPECKRAEYTSNREKRSTRTSVQLTGCVSII